MTTRRRGVLVALVLAVVLGWVAQPQAALSVRVLAVTHVQAVLEYTAPDGDPCTVEVSEEADYSPVVHDVNETLFPGASRDDTDRDTTVCDDGTCGDDAETRTVVIGRYGMDVPPGGTNWWLGDDSAYYSRALQADTTHYFEIDCGGTDVGTGSFTTQTIPYNMTFKDPNPVRSPGVENWYTLPADDRSAVVIDPYTGARISRWTLQAEEDGHAFGVGSGGGSQLCSGVLLANGGYLCGITRSGGEANALYWFHPTTGEIRHLGIMYYGSNGDPTDGWAGTNYYFSDGGVAWSHTEGNVVYTIAVSQQAGKRIVLKLTYTGNYQAVSPGTNVSWTGTNLTKPSEDGSLTDMVAAFDATYDGTRFPCGIVGATEGGHITFACRRSVGGQDTYGYLGAYDLATNAVIAVTPSWTRPGFRWQVLHTVFPGNGADVIFVAAKGVYGDSVSGPWKTTLAANINTTQTTITVAGHPYCTEGTPSNCYGESADDDTTLLDWLADDYLYVESTGEWMQVTSVGGGGTSLGVTRDVYSGDGVGQAASSGAVVRPDTINPDTAGTISLVWDYVNDPTGTDLGGYFCPDGDIAYSHEGMVGRATGPWLRWSGWKWTTGVLPTSCTTPTAAVERTPEFAGTDSPGEGNTFEIHPSMAQFPWTSGIYAQYMLDINKTVGGNTFTENTTTGLVAVGGTTYLYRYVPNNIYPELLPRPRRIPQFGMTEQLPLQMITGTLNDTADDNYKFCYVERTNECVTGSTVGQVYVNLPSAPTYMGCAGGHAVPSDPDVCIGNAIFYGNATVQIGTTTTGARVNTGGTFNTYKWDYSRVLFVYPSRYRQLSEGATLRATPDGRWAFFPLVSDSTSLDGVGLVRIPSMPTTPETKYDTYVQNQVTWPNVSGTYPTVHNVVVKVGYVEYGTTSQFYCTQRQEACYFGNVAADGDGNYLWPAAEDTSCAGSKPCAGYAADGGGTAGNQIVGVACATGCTMTVPTLPGKIAYVQAVYRASNNTTLGTSQVVVLPGLSQIGRVQ